MHVIFDNPGRLNNTPKYFEHKRRDPSVMIRTDHYCDSISSTTMIPKKWRENLLNCRKCKRSLVKYLTHFFLHYMHKHLIQNQTLYLAGGHDDAISDSCWYVSYNNKPKPDLKYSNNSEETDTRIWLHVLKSECTRILVISPDTDVYHIGLPLVTNSGKDIAVQVSAINSKEVRFVNLSALAYALVNDPDLAALKSSDLPQILQTLFVCTGCDYISFFSGIGKATFMRHFFQHAPFITGTNRQGSLANIQLEGEEYKKGFLAFLRLVGTVYLKKNISGFKTPSSASHFLQFAKVIDPTTQHIKWIEDVRQTVADRATFDSNMIPSTEALFFHWKRTCWILRMWAQSNKNTMVLKPITDYGWSLQNDLLHITWDTNENMQMVRERVSLLLKGCKCITGCKNMICGCRKRGTKCTEGCQCVNCKNQVTAVEEREDLVYVALEETLLTGINRNSDEEDDFAEYVFAAAFDLNTEPTTIDNFET